MNKYYMAFLYACMDIGRVSVSNGRFQEMLYRSIKSVNGAWEAMTVKDLLDSIEAASDEFNKLEKIARGES